MSSDNQLSCQAIVICTLSVAQPSNVYNAAEFRDSIRDLSRLIEGLRQEQENEWLRVLECTDYLVKIVLKATEEIIAEVDIDDELRSGE